MTAIRYTIYAGGGFLLLLGWAAWASASGFALSPVVMIAFGVLGVVALYVCDRVIHAAFYGRRVRFRVADYQPCEVCPFTKKVGTDLRFLVASMDGGGFGTAFYRMPVLVSAKVAAERRKPELHRIPGLKVARFTHKMVVLYIRDRDYYLAFVRRNERALLE